jgi:hypothetical protein
MTDVDDDERAWLEDVIGAFAADGARTARSPARTRRSAS